MQQDIATALDRDTDTVFYFQIESFVWYWLIYYTVLVVNCFIAVINLIVRN